jgi:mannose-6-phosphate isomerase-like protein (cupin superfamily)
VRHEQADDAAKGWFLGPWNSDLPVSVGFANEGVDEPHLHARMTELYLVARGTSTIRIDDRTVELAAGDLLVVEPGEAHTFLASSDDYFHFVVHAPALVGEEARADKHPVSRERLGL